MKPLSVGISVHVTDDAHAWSNGINQNLAFLVQCLRAVPGVGQVFLVNDGPARELPPTLEFDALPARLVQPQDVTHELDVVIEMGAKLPQPWIRRVRALGVRIISFLVGHSYTGMIEPAMLGKEQTIGVVNLEPDEVWLMHKDMHSSSANLRVLLRAPVFELPHLWAPDFLQRRIDELARSGQVYGFDAGRRAGAAQGWRAAIFEPNIGVVKSCFVPMLACEAAYRQRSASLAHMMVMNTVHMKEHLTFNRFATVLDLVRDSRASFEPRLPLPDCMSVLGRDLVVSHQWENDQNYLYYDVLHGGYPLVHNSAWLSTRAPGFYYPGFAAQEGGRQIVRAWQQPAEFWQDYRRDAHRFLATLSPTHEANVRAFAERLGLAGYPAASAVSSAPSRVAA